MNARDVLNKALHCLSYREREIVKLRFGLWQDRQRYTLQEVADVFKCTPERVRQIQTKALRKLRDNGIILHPSSFLIQPYRRRPTEAQRRQHVLAGGDNGGRPPAGF